MDEDKTTQFPGPFLPNELAHLILDHLSNGLTGVKHSILYRPSSLKSLLECSLVSQSFHDRVAHHLFAHLTITQNMIHPRSQSRRTVSGLLDLLDCDPHFSNRVRSLKLYLPSPVTVDPTASSAFQDRNLATLLNRLTRLSSFHVLAIGPSIYRFAKLPTETRVAFENILRTPSLTQIQIHGVSGLPADFFEGCVALSKLECYTSPWFDDRHGDGSPSSVPGCSHTIAVPFRLQVAWIRSCDFWVARMISGLAFSELKTLRYDLRQEASSLLYLAEIAGQAASTIESLCVTELHAPSFLDDLRLNPIDITSMGSLREIFIHSYGSFERHGTRLLKPVSDILSGISAQNSADATIRTVELIINWGSIPVANDGFMFDPEDKEWTDLDGILSQRSHFRCLSKVSVRLTAGFKLLEASSTQQGPSENQVAQRLGQLFQKVRNMSHIQFSLSVATFVV